MKNYLVSIIIATYRRSIELENAIKSALNQSYQNCEIIVVDDNDNDLWNEKVHQIINKLDYGKNIRLIQNHPNQGSARTRNIGIQSAKGEYIVFLDDDDIYLPERVEKQLEAMIADGADYGITDIVLYNEDDSVNEVRKREYLTTKERNNLLTCHLKYHMTGTDTLMFRKEYLTKIGCFDSIDSGDEYYLMMKAVRNGGVLSYIPRSDVKAYVHTGEGGLSSGEGKIKGENILYQYKKNFFDDLNYKDRKYITMRHYAVLAFAYLRMKKPIHFFINGVFSFISSPIACVQLLKNRVV